MAISAEGREANCITENFSKLLSNTVTPKRGMDIVKVKGLCYWKTDHLGRLPVTYPFCIWGGNVLIYCSNTQKWVESDLQTWLGKKDELTIGEYI